LKRTISKEAEAEREKRAVIIKAQGDKEAADNLALAAKKLQEVPGAMHLRTLQAINDLSSDQSNTTI
jgi:regulator of protease activity HflC (stomatin/prohibitin superfamily)